jgi:hypothetical protein
MNATVTSYNLYCINASCTKSVFNEIRETKMPFTEKNILAKHACRGCRSQLVSMIDIEIERTLYEAAIGLPR